VEKTYNENQGSLLCFSDSQLDEGENKMAAKKKATKKKATKKKKK
jgi:hypothetical protein